MVHQLVLICYRKSTYVLFLWTWGVATINVLRLSKVVDVIVWRLDSKPLVTTPPSIPWVLSDKRKACAINCLWYVYCLDDDATLTNGTPSTLKRQWDDNGQDVQQKMATRKEPAKLTSTNAEATGARQFGERYITVGSAK